MEYIKTLPAIDVYRLPEGTSVYHASCTTIETFGQVTFLTLELELAKAVLLAGRIYRPENGRYGDYPGALMRTCYIYEFKVSHDTNIFHNKLMETQQCRVVAKPVTDSLITTYHDCGPYDPQQSVHDFCEENRCAGYWNERVIAPITPLFRHIFGEELKLEDESDAFTGLKSEYQRIVEEPDYFFERYIDYHHLYVEPDDIWYFPSIQLPEIVLCDPSMHLDMITIHEIDGEELVAEYRQRALTIMSSIIAGNNLDYSLEDYEHWYVFNRSD